MIAGLKIVAEINTTSHLVIFFKLQMTMIYSSTITRRSNKLASVFQVRLNSSNGIFLHIDVGKIEMAIKNPWWKH